MHATFDGAVIEADPTTIKEKHKHGIHIQIADPQRPGHPTR